MRPDTDAPSADLDQATLAAEGASYARALLDRIEAGASSADDLVGTLQFMGAGQMLHGAAVVLLSALRLAVRARGPSVGECGVQTPAPGGPSNAR